MKVTNITNVDKFFEVVDKCEGKVELITGDGDCLNLKSKLSQYAALIKMLAHGKIDQMEIIAENNNDTVKLMAFMMNG